MTCLCPTCGQSVPEVDDLQFHHELGAVIYHGKSARLTPREADFFAALHRRAPAVVQRYAILDSMYGVEADQPESRSLLSVYAMKINRKLGSMGLHITPSAGRGYRLEFGNSA